MEYDQQFLIGEYFKSLRVPSASVWTEVKETAPKPFEPVLVCGPTWKHEVAYLDSVKGCWIVRGQQLLLEDFPHWQPLPAPPFYP